MLALRPNHTLRVCIWAIAGSMLCGRIREEACYFKAFNTGSLTHASVEPYPS